MVSLLGFSATMKHQTERILIKNLTDLRRFFMIGKQADDEKRKNLKSL